MRELRARSNGPFQLNTQIPDPDPPRNSNHEKVVCQFLGDWGPEVESTAADVPFPNFTSQCKAMLEEGPAVISFIMGLYSSTFVSELKTRGIKWFATVTSVS